MKSLTELCVDEIVLHQNLQEDKRSLDELIPVYYQPILQSLFESKRDDFANKVQEYRHLEKESRIFCLLWAFSSHNIIIANYAQHMPSTDSGAKNGFIEACKHGNLANVTYLLQEFEAYRQEMIRSSYYVAFRMACQGGYMEIAKLLFKTSQNKQEMISADDYGAFRGACGGGHLEIAQWLYDESHIEIKQAMIKARNFAAWGSACSQGHLNIVQWLLEKISSENSQTLIQNVFSEVCLYGRLEVAQLLFKVSGYNQEMIKASNFLAFRWACGSGHIRAVQWLLDVVSTDHKQEMIEAANFNDRLGDQNDKTGFQGACAGGHLEIAQLLFKTSENKQAIIGTNNFNAFYQACDRNHLKSAQWLLKVVSPEDKQRMINSISKDGNFCAFDRACTQGYLAIAQLLLEASENKQAMIRVKCFDHGNRAGGNFYVFLMSCSLGHLDIAQWLFQEVTEEHKQAMIKVCDNKGNDFGPYKRACENSHEEIARWLLEVVSPERKQEMFAAFALPDTPRENQSFSAPALR